MGSIGFSHFRAIMNNDLIRDDQQVVLVKNKKGDGVGLRCAVTGEARTFSLPSDDTTAGAKDIRSQLVELARKQLSKMKSDPSAVLNAIRTKLLGGGAEKGKPFVFKPLDKRTIAEVVNLVDAVTGKKTSMVVQAPTDMSALNKMTELDDFLSRHDKIVAEMAAEQKGGEQIDQGKSVKRQGDGDGVGETGAKTEVAPAPEEFKATVNTRPLTLKDIAQTALATVAGAPDDKLCMGVANGFAVRFLAPGNEPQGEKKVSGRLYEIDKEVINSATRELKDALLGLAGGLDADKLANVKALLAAEPDKNGLEVLSRSAVADAVKIIAGELRGKEGELDVDELQAAQDAGDVSLDAVLLSKDENSRRVHAWFDARRQADLAFMKSHAGEGAASIGSHKKEYLIDVYNQVKANPPDARTLALLDKEFAVVKGTDARLDQVATHSCSSNPFVLLEREEGIYSSSRATDEAIRRTGGPVCTDIAADTTNHGGYIAWGASSGQEECTFSDLSSALVAYETAKGAIQYAKSENGSSVLQYTKNEEGDRDLWAAAGFVVNSEKITTDMEPNENQEFQQVKLLFNSMPSFNTGANKDIGGGASWLRLNLARINGGNANFTKAQKLNSEKFFAAVFDAAKDFDESPKYGFGEHVNGLHQCGEMLMLAQFLGDPRVFDPLADNVDEQVAKLVEVMNKGDYKGLLEKALDNYKATIQNTMSRWIKSMVASGAKAFVGSAMGCGFFRNPSYTVAKTFAKLYIEMGSDIPIFFAKYRRGDRLGDVWRNAFAEAWQEHLANVKIASERDPATAIGKLREKIDSIVSKGTSGLEKRTDLKDFLMNRFFEQSFPSSSVAQLKNQLKAQSRNNLSNMLKAALGAPSGKKAEPRQKLGDDLDAVARCFVDGDRKEGERLLLDLLKTLQANEPADSQDARMREANRKFIDFLEREVNSVR